jgi:outer membrane protein assembly factor BamD
MGRAWKGEPGRVLSGPVRLRTAGWTFVLAVLLAACASTPPWMGMDGDQLFEYGLEQFEDRDWDEAILAFERLVASFPGHARGAEARMYLARAHFRKGEFISAAAEFERFLQRYPSHGLAPEASLGICRAYAELAPHPQRDQEYTQRAREACRATASEFQGMNVAQEADSIRVTMVERLGERWFQEGRFYQRRNFHDSAILIFQDVVDFFPETSWAPRSLLALYRSYEAIGWEEEARQSRDRLLFLYPDSEAAREVREERADGDGDVR